MTTRLVKLGPYSQAAACPSCGNTSSFRIRSERCAEDCCEVWAECVCGFRPEGAAFEDVWGGCGDDNVQGALGFWNEAVSAKVGAPGGGTR